MDTLSQAEDVREAGCHLSDAQSQLRETRHVPDHAQHNPPLEPVHAYPSAAHAAAPDLARRDHEVAEHFGERGEDVREDDVAEEGRLAGWRDEDPFEGAAMGQASAAIA